MDGFGDSFVPAAEGAAVPPATEVDPAAEFLAREQDQLAGLEDDLAAVTVSAAPDSTGLGGGDSGDLFGSTPAPADAPVIVNGTADLESFEMLGGDEVAPELSDAPAAASELLGGEGLGGDFGFSEGTAAATDFLGEASATPVVVDEGLGVDYSALSMAGASEAAQEPVVAEPIEQQQPAVPASTTPLRSVTPTPVVREEPEKIRVWREEQITRMEEKDKQEEQAKEELRLKAKAELEEWYKQHEEQVAKTRQANRSAEKELVAETSAIEPGTEWERISKLCDFNPKTAKSTRDISRMRSIILQVKQNPPVKA